MAFFDTDAKQRIERTIAEVEQRTSGELVVVTVKASDAYSTLRLLYAASSGLAATAILHWLWPALAASWLLCALPLFAALKWLGLGIGPFLRFIVPAPHAQACVERRAREVFFERNLFATRARSGVLILLSELERRVVILGDVGIHAAVKTDGWEQHVARIVTAIRQGRAAEGVCEVIAALGDVLAKDLPRPDDDRDELPNDVREQS